MFVPRANSQKYDSSSISDDRTIRQGINESLGDFQIDAIWLALSANEILAMAANQRASLKHQFGILMEHNYKRNKVSRQKNKNFYRMIEKKRLKKQKIQF